MLSPLTNSPPSKRTPEWRFDGDLNEAALQASLHIGVDEAGRGCLAGPVVAAAMVFAPFFDFATLLPGLNDSKKLSEKRRRLMVPLITQHCVAYGIGLSWQDEIDRINILNATFRAMSRALLALAAKMQALASSHAPVEMPPLIIDGTHTIPLTEWQSCLRGVPVSALAWEQYLPLPSIKLPPRIPALPEQHAFAGADGRFPSVSAASVLAKTYRDGLMVRLDEFYPGYSFAVHKGYGTPEHLAVLDKKGHCPLHRKTFKHVRTEERQFSLI